MGFKINTPPERLSALTTVEITPVFNAQPARTINIRFSWDRLDQSTLLQLLAADKTKKDQVTRLKALCLGDIIKVWNVKDEAGSDVAPDVVTVTAMPAIVIDALFAAVKPSPVGATGYMVDVAVLFA